jgi:glycogen debranching enzyme
METQTERPDIEIVEGDPFYVHTPRSPAGERDLVLKQDETFVVVDQHGDIRRVGLAEQGLYHLGTRYLSTCSIAFGRQPPLLLSSAVRDDNAWITVDLTNTDVSEGGLITIPRGTVHLARQIVLWDGVLYERFTLRNYGATTVTVPLAFRFAADYRDIFEVRGTPRARRGARLEPDITAATAVIGYRGLDDGVRRTRIHFDPAPERLSASEASYTCRLPPQGEDTRVVTFACEQERPPRRSPPKMAEATVALATMLESRRGQTCEITTSSQQFNEWLQRSDADLAMMITATPFGPYPYAGVPWFSTPFGRDGLITALECLWANPEVAHGVLSFLSATQATRTNPEQDAQPGKILHEMRAGEMAALGEIPFGRYYGSHDSTPLFVMLAAAYYERTADRDFIETLWPSIAAALQWIERDGDVDDDGFVEYARQSPTGLVHQGWKDSHDSVHHVDGQLAEGPIALCEIQGYVYAAWRGAATLARVLGKADDAAEWSRKAEALRQQFEARFWNEERGLYVLALDGRKRQCAVTASNAGHLLFTGIASPERAAAVASKLMAPESFSGWGIRTLATTEVRYNPMSYHNGSVWPHDNAIVAAGFQRYGRRAEALAVLSGLFETSLSMDLRRLPELFCGFARRPGESPTAYPVSCNPQAWAAASVFLLLQSALGLEIQASDRVVRFTGARLPSFIDEMHLRNLRVGSGSLDLRLQRYEGDVGIHVLRRDGDIQVVGIK